MNLIIRIIITTIDGVSQVNILINSRDAAESVQKALKVLVISFGSR